MNLKAMKHFCDPRILAFYSEQFGAPGTAKNFAAGRIGPDDGDESLHYSQRLNDRCPGIDRDGLDGLPRSEAEVGERLSEHRNCLAGHSCSSPCHCHRRVGCWHRDIFRLGMNRYSSC